MITSKKRNALRINASKARKHHRRQRTEMIRNLFQQYRHTQPIPSEIMDHLRDTFVPTSPTTKRGGISIYRRHHAAKKLTREDTVRLCCSIGLTYIPQNTASLKKRIVNFVLTQPISFRSACINYLLSKRKYVASRGLSGMEVSIRYAYFRELLKSLNFSFNQYCSGIYITEGSFFINDHWVHIG